MKGTDPDIQPKMPTMPSKRSEIPLFEMLLVRMYYTAFWRMQQVTSPG
jgi:hypothetical protein